MIVRPVISDEDELSCLWAGRHTHLQPGVDAHVFQEGPLSDGSQAGHAPSSHPPQVAEVHVSGEVGGAGRGQDVMEPVTFETLTNGKKNLTKAQSQMFSFSLRRFGREQFQPFPIRLLFASVL